MWCEEKAWNTGSGKCRFLLSQSALILFFTRSTMCTDAQGSGLGEQVWQSQVRITDSLNIGVYWACDCQLPSGPPTILLNHICFSNFAGKKSDISLNKDKVRIWTHVICIKCQLFLFVIGHHRGHWEARYINGYCSCHMGAGDWATSASPHTNMLLWSSKALSFFICHLISWTVTWGVLYAHSTLQGRKQEPKRSILLLLEHREEMAEPCSSPLMNISLFYFPCYSPGQ